MSYEGYSQLLCKYGHYWTVDCYQVADSLHDNLCPHGHPAVWENMVNTTNGSYDDYYGTVERIDEYVELKPKKMVKCEHCGSVLEERYNIPKPKRRAK